VTLNKESDFVFVSDLLHFAKYEWFFVLCARNTVVLPH